MQRVSHSLAFLSLLGAVLSGSVGCADFTASVDLVIELGTVDLDARREALEAAVCASPTGENCAVLCALSDCGFDPAVGPTGELPRLPPEFPGQVDVAALTDRVDVQDWFAGLQEGGLASDLDTLQDLDAGALLGTHRVRLDDLSMGDVDPDLFADTATIDSASVVATVDQMTVTFPGVDIFIGEGLAAEPVAPVPAEGDVVIEEPAAAAAEDGEEPIHIARSDALPAAGGEASLSFTNNALGRLIDGIGTPGAFIEMRPWEGVPVGLVDGAAPGTLVRPAGTVALTLQVRLRVPVEVLLSAAQSVPSAP
jgi:hypothetical protein